MAGHKTPERLAEVVEAKAEAEVEFELVESNDRTEWACILDSVVLGSKHWARHTVWAASEALVVPVVILVVILAVILVVILVVVLVVVLVVILIAKGTVNHVALYEWLQALQVVPSFESCKIKRFVC
jgi:hypothetical protein